MLQDFNRSLGGVAGIQRFQHGRASLRAELLSLTRIEQQRVERIR